MFFLGRGLVIWDILEVLKINWSLKKKSKYFSTNLYEKKNDPKHKGGVLCFSKGGVLCFGIFCKC